MSRSSIAGAIVSFLKWVGALLLASWLVLWLILEITFATVHVLLLIGIAALAAGFLKFKTGR
jgi:hypothetical protein